MRRTRDTPSDLHKFSDGEVRDRGELLRIAIPFLRLLPAYSALLVLATLYEFGPGAFVHYAPPLQKLFCVPIAQVLWACLALTPFVLLRSRAAFHIYVSLYLGCLAFMAYDYFVPFRYVAPNFQGEVRDGGGGFSRAGNDNSIDYWISYPTTPRGENWIASLFLVTPLILAFVYRRCYP